jgi:uncharacterized protein YijF (DUF1287 family)
VKTGILPKSNLKMKRNRNPVLKIIALVLAPLLLAASIFIYLAGYHEPRDFSDAKTDLPRSEVVVANARSLAGTPYDPFMGKYGDIGAKAGFIVCSDVPNIAYGLSGFSIKRMLEDDCRKNPSAYANNAEGNKPGGVYFHRRARNLYAYFKNSDRLFSSVSAPRVGDMAFYKRKSNGYVSHVALVTEVNEGSYTVMESAPETLIAQEKSGASLQERGYILLGFGRMYLEDVMLAMS